MSLCGTVCSARISIKDDNYVSMEAAPYTAEILVSKVLLSAAGRRALKVNASVQWDILNSLLCSACISFILFRYSCLTHLHV
jgi:hypothetical protein